MSQEILMATVLGGVWRKNNEMHACDLKQDPLQDFKEAYP